MTNKEALKKAQEIFGNTAMIKRTKKSSPHLNTHRVGLMLLGRIFNIKGTGKNWDEAFLNIRK